MSAGLSGDMETGIYLYWLPLGAGGHSVRLNGRIYEAIVSRRARRPAYNLYHSALEVRIPEGRFVIEQAPLGADPATRGVVAQGPVGTRLVSRLRLFRYEVRRWRDGVIPDLAEAVDSPQLLSDDVRQARLLLDIVSGVPTHVWGRDELGTGDMWNSNSVISWLIATVGLPTETIKTPKNGRAPGWDAGVVIARREQSSLMSRSRSEIRVGTAAEA